MFAVMLANFTTKGVADAFAHVSAFGLRWFVKREVAGKESLLRCILHCFGIFLLEEGGSQVFCNL